MQNAKQEFLKHIERRQIKCATISCDNNESVLPINNTPGQWEDFLSSLDYEYDDNCGTLNLYGTIWYEDGSWSNRCDDDGSEWWVYNKYLEIPTECIEYDPDVEVFVQ